MAAFEWDGRNDAGATMAPGPYTFQITALGGGQNVAAAPVASGVVSAVMPGAGGSRLVVDGLGEMMMQQIRGIR